MSNVTTFRSKLELIDACTAACDWVDGKTAAEAWQTCERGDWMLWLLGRLSGLPDSDSRRKLVGIAAGCAELVLPIYEKKHPDDTRVRDCIEGCKAYAAGDPSMTLNRLRELRRTVAFANAAAKAANAAASVAFAAFTAADAVAFTASAAFTDAAADAVLKSMQKQCADIVRKHCPQPPEFDNLLGDA